MKHDAEEARKEAAALLTHQNAERANRKTVAEIKLDAAKIGKEAKWSAGKDGSLLMAVGTAMGAGKGIKFDDKQRLVSIDPEFKQEFNDIMDAASKLATADPRRDKKPVHEYVREAMEELGKRKKSGATPPAATATPNVKRNLLKKTPTSTPR